MMCANKRLTDSCMREHICGEAEGHDGDCKCVSFVICEVSFPHDPRCECYRYAGVPGVKA